MSLSNANATLSSYTTSHNTVAQSLMSQNAQLRAAKQRIVNAESLNDHELADLKTTITSLQNSIASSTASLDQLVTAKKNANALLNTNYPVPVIVGTPTSNYYGGPTGTTGPQGKTNPVVVDSVVTQGSTNPVSSSAVSSAIASASQLTTAPVGTLSSRDSMVPQNGSVWCDGQDMYVYCSSMWKQLPTILSILTSDNA